jgi:hypothetical protein
MVPIINGQKQPQFVLQPNELRIFGTLNMSGTTLYQINVDGHDFVLVGRDGIPRVASSPDLMADPVKTDWTHIPAGRRLQWLMPQPGQRYEYFIIPKAGVTPVAGDVFNIYMMPVDQSEVYTNSAFPQPVVMGSIKYDGAAIASSASNAVQNLINLLPNPTLDKNADNSPAVPVEDKKSLAYITSVSELQSLLGATPIVATYSGAQLINNGDGTASVTLKDYAGVVSATHAGEHHRLELGARIAIAGADYVITSMGFLPVPGGDSTLETVRQADTFKISEPSGVAWQAGQTYQPGTLLVDSGNLYCVTEPHISSSIANDRVLDVIKLCVAAPVSSGSRPVPATGTVDYTYDLYKLSLVNNQQTSQANQEIVEILTEHYFYRNIALPVEAISGHIARIHKMYFAIYPTRGLAGMGEGSTSDTNTQGYEDNSRHVSYLNTNEEISMINKSSFVHEFHIHINEYQVCGYRDEAFGLNGFTDAVHAPSEYSYTNEIDVPFEGFEDTTTLPVGRYNDNGIQIVPDEVDPGLRGEIRLRTKFADYTGLFVTHCHLLDDQDMGMMMQFEVVGAGYTQGADPAKNPNVTQAAPFGDQFEGHFSDAVQ